MRVMCAECATSSIALVRLWPHRASSLYHPSAMSSPAVPPAAADSPPPPPAAPDASSNVSADVALPSGNRPSVPLPALPPAVVDEHERSMRWATDEAQRILLASSASGSSSSGASPVPRSSVLPRPMRINALDAASLDAELGLMLSHSLRKVFKYFSPLAERKAELDLLLGALVFAATIWADQPTPGMKLQNVHLANHAAVSAMRGGGSKIMSWIGALVTGAKDAVTAKDAPRMEELRSMLPSAPLSHSALSSASSSPAAIALSNFDAISRRCSTSWAAFFYATCGRASRTR
jgi:hypothetical protein